MWNIAIERKKSGALVYSDLGAFWVLFGLGALDSTGHTYSVERLVTISLVMAFELLYGYASTV